MRRIDHDAGARPAATGCDTPRPGITGRPGRSKRRDHSAGAPPSPRYLPRDRDLVARSDRRANLADELREYVATLPADAPEFAVEERLNHSQKADIPKPADI